jgi:hypothetical protein
MITREVIKKVRDFAYSQAEKYGAPSIFHLDYANEKGQWLAGELGADKKVVLLGTLLMDCMLGVALKEGKLSEHIEMSANKAEEVLAKFPELDKSEVKNVVACVQQHHGVEKFVSLEAEVCCNADCYRFASVKGALGGMVTGRKMGMDELVALYMKKAEEKWKVLTLEICKRELEPQYSVIMKFLNSYK